MITATLDASAVTREYGAALRQLAALTGFSPKAVLLGEAGAILKAWFLRTKSTPQAKSDRASRLTRLRKLHLTQAEEVGQLTINAGIHGPEGRVWRKVGKNGKFLLVGQLLPGGQGINWASAKAAHWSRYKSVVQPVRNYLNSLPAQIEKGRRASGLARQSVMQIAQSLGIDLQSVPSGGDMSGADIAKARNALATNGRAYRNGTGTITGTGSETAIRFVNSLPYGIPTGMDRTLVYTMSGREKFFERSYAKGAFDSIGTAARAYPWMRFSSNLN